MNELTDYPTPPITCPGCGEKMDGALATKPEQGGPADGAVAICFRCSTISVYITVAGQLQLRYPTEAELVTILKDSHVARIIAAVQVVRERQ